MNDWVQVGADADDMLDGFVELARKVPLTTAEMAEVFGQSMRNFEYGTWIMTLILATAVNRLAAPTTDVVN